MKEQDIIIKISKELLDNVLSDLKRPHKFAAERIGFFESKIKKTSKGEWIIFLMGYHSIPDDQYIDDPEVGARINSDAIRETMSRSMKSQHGCFHVHYHSFSFGKPEFSDTDLVDNPEIVKSLSRVSKNQVHGMFLIGNSGLNAIVKIPNSESLVKVDKIVVVGYPMQFCFPKKEAKISDSDMYDRQSFLGEYSQFYIENVRIGVIGLGGGGSHIIQQLAHLGNVHYNLFEYDVTTSTNINRNVGTLLSDIENETKKIDVSERVIRGLIPHAVINKIEDEWQNSPEDLQVCDIVVGCVDTFNGRRDLEVECRRYMIPYIDIGMDIHDKYETENPSMSGQFILSMPGSHCMKCMHFLTEKNLAKEAAKYGDNGGKPQVVWSNGVLASSAIGIVVDLITGWSGLKDRKVYLLYDGNNGTLTEHPRLKFLKSECNHFPITVVGPVEFKSF